MSETCTRLNLVSSESGGTSADSLDRSPGSLETSGGPECGEARFGAAHKPGLIIVHPALSLNPAFTTSKNLPEATGRTNAYVGPLRLPGALGIDVTQGQRAHTKPPKKPIDRLGEQDGNCLKTYRRVKSGCNHLPRNAASPKAGVGVGAVGGLLPELLSKLNAGDM